MTQQPRLSSLKKKKEAVPAQPERDAKAQPATSLRDASETTTEDRLQTETVPEGRKKFFAGLTDEKNRLTPSAARYAIWLGLRVFADYKTPDGRDRTRRVLTIDRQSPRQIVLDADARTVTVAADAVTLLWTPQRRLNTEGQPCSTATETTTDTASNQSAPSGPLSN